MFGLCEAAAVLQTEKNKLMASAAMKHALERSRNLIGSFRCMALRHTSQSYREIKIKKTIETNIEARSLRFVCLISFRRLCFPSPRTLPAKKGDTPGAIEMSFRI